jgi:D-alanyl-D-alanine carboxypeptidase (penicillin-binding protein 5/6)
VVAGETLTEIEALEALLIPSGNNIATLLADWDAGSTTAFVAKMNSAAANLGLGSTHFSDVSGLDPDSVSTPSDLIRLGEAAMALPAFAQVVAMGEATLPVAGLVYNFDYDLDHDGIIGIKTGTDSAAGGCFLFVAERTVDAEKVTLVGAVLGQQTSSPITAVLAAAESLTNAAFTAMASLPVVPAGLPVGRIVVPWGPAVAVRATTTSRIVAWPGLILPALLHVGPLPTVVVAGTPIGFLRLDLDGRSIEVTVRASGTVGRPSVIWRLTRL